MSDKPRFVYVTYIRTTPETLWAALTDPQTIRKYWFGITAVKLTINHELEGEGTKFVEAVSGGWPKVLSTSSRCWRPATSHSRCSLA